ncbi:MAG: hypothetical protein RLZZ144_820 [Pseudomonadota bacterium]|jgi:SlyX protein
MIEERLELIETKIMFQEDLMEELNKTIYEQQKKLQQLEAVCLALVRQIQSVAESTNDTKSANERPPHY